MLEVNVYNPCFDPKKMKRFFGSDRIEYKESQLLEYISERVTSADLMFYGYESFQTLAKNKMIIPKKTILRIDDGYSGEHYICLSENVAEGVVDCPYPGKEGIHEIEDLFKNYAGEPIFSIDGIFIPDKFGIRPHHWKSYSESRPFKL